MVKKLDFIVIGAAKSATTSLHELLKNHPDIFIPSAKEVPFFSDNTVYKNGIDNYMEAYFSGAEKRQKWGTITPQYMLDSEEVKVNETASRIYEVYPDIKIIALLRNPAERAFSHYKMQVQRGYEHRDFEKVVNEALQNPARMRDETSPVKSYIFASEYGRILSYYYALFPHENIMVITTDDLRDRPVETVGKLCSFIGVNTSYTPENPNQRHRKGGSKPKARLLTPGFLYSLPMVEKIWKNYTPQTIRKRTEYFINLWNTKSDDSKLDSEDPSYEKLMKYYSDDIKKLEKLTGKNMSWGKIN